MPHSSHSSLIEACKEVRYYKFHDDFFKKMTPETPPSTFDRHHYRDLVSVTRLIRAYLTSSSLEQAAAVLAADTAAANAAAATDIADGAAVATADVAVVAADAAVVAADAGVATDVAVVAANAAVAADAAVVVADVAMVAIDAGVAAHAGVASDGAVVAADAVVVAADGGVATDVAMVAADAGVAADAEVATDAAMVAADAGVLAKAVEGDILSFMEGTKPGSSAALTKLRELPNQPEKFYHQLHATMLPLLRKERFKVRSNYYNDRIKVIQRCLGREKEVSDAPKEKKQFLIDSIRKKWENIMVSLK